MSRGFHIPRWRELSVVTLVVTSMVMLTTAVLAIFAVANYQAERKKLWGDLRMLAKLDADQLAQALTLPVWNFDRLQINRVVESIMQDRILVAVVLLEENGRHTRTTWTRADDGRIRQDESEFSGEGYLREVRAVRSSSDTVLANVQLYSTTKFLNEDLQRSLAKTLGLILLIDVVLTIGLYWLLRCWVFAPLRSVEAFARAVSSGGAADSVVASRRFQGELESLRQSIQTTLSKLELRLSEKNRAQAALRREVDFDELVTRLMAGFVSATAVDIDEQIIGSLREIAMFVGVEFGGVFQVFPDRTAWRLTHEWYAPGVGSKAELFKHMPMGSSDWMEKRILANEPIVVNSIREIPAQASEIRERWEKQGFKALLGVPLRGRGGYINGALGLFSFAGEVEWQKTDLTQVRVIGEAIANTLERQLAEESLLQSRQQLRALTGRLQSLREEERTRISREIHDHLGQLLTALKLDLKSVERRVGALQDAEAKQTVGAKLNSAQQLADETLQSVQKIASELRPGILDRLGLAAAIEAEAAAFQSRAGVRCDVEVSNDPISLPPEHATTVFRIVQELLTNIARHAQASRAWVNLSFSDGWLVLEVRDDGVGMGTSDIDNPKSLGILGVQERAALLGGMTEFAGAAGKGTTVTVKIPYPSSRNETSADSR